MKQWIKRCTVLSVAVMMAGSLAACGQKAAPNPSTTRTQNYQMHATPNYTNGMQPYGNYTPYAAPGGVHPYTTGNTKQHAAADRAASVAAKVPGVTHATAVVHGKDVVVGLDINNVTRGRAKIERDVQRAVKSAEPGYNVHVTADRGIHQRVRTLNDRVRAGHPIHTLTQDVGVLIRDIGRAVTTPFR